MREITTGIVARATHLIMDRDIDMRAATTQLAEYTKLKDEIANRSTLQNAIVTLNIAAVGTLGGFVVGRSANTLILLLLIPLSTALGLLWLDHAQTIVRIGDYIRLELWPRLIEGRRENDLVKSYEDLVPKTPFLGASTYIVPFFVVFLGPSIASVAATFHAVRSDEEWGFWGADVAVATFCTAVWVDFLQSTYRRGKEKPAEARIGDREHQKASPGEEGAVAV